MIARERTDLVLTAACSEIRENFVTNRDRMDDNTREIISITDSALQQEAYAGSGHPSKL